MTKEEFIKDFKKVLDDHHVRYREDSDTCISFETETGHFVFVSPSELSVAIGIYEDKEIGSPLIAGVYPFYEKINSVHDGLPKTEAQFNSIFISEGLSFVTVQVRKRQW